MWVCVLCNFLGGGGLVHGLCGCVVPPPLTPTIHPHACIPTYLSTNKQPGVLYTEAFERTQAARARGVCAGITRPGKKKMTTYLTPFRCSVSATIQHTSYHIQ